MAITRLSFPEALSEAASPDCPPCVAWVSDVPPAVVAVVWEPPPQPARHPAAMDTATNKDNVLFFILILLLLF